MAAAFAAYAIEHLLLSSVLLLVAGAAWRAVPAAARHRWLAGGFVLAVVGPLLPLALIPSAGAPMAAITAGPTAHAAAGLSIDPTWAIALLGVWGVGAVVRLTRMFGAWRAAARLVRGNPRALDIERKHADLLPRGVRVHLSVSFGPAVLGVVDPCIVLPAPLVDRLSCDSLRAVLAHEAAHIHRRDPRWHALQRATLAVLWWNPALARLSRWLDESRELACDAAAARRGGDTFGYAEALLDVARQPRADTLPPALAGLAMASTSPVLDQRIDALLDTGERRRTWRIAAGVLLVVAMLAGWATVAAMAPDVRIAPAARATTSPAGAPATHAPASARVPATTPTHAPTSTSDEARQALAAGKAAFDRDAEAARIGFEQQSQAAQIDFEQRSQAAQIAFEQQSQAAQIDFEERTQAAEIAFEQRMARAERELRLARENAR